MRAATFVLSNHRPSWMAYANVTLVGLVAMLLVPQGLYGQTSTPTSPSTEAEANVETEKADTDQINPLHAALSQLMTGSTLRGHFTVDGQSDGLKEERYEIQRVTKLPAGEMWLFNVRIRYGDHDVTVPLPLKVQWAGQTPMIIVDHLTIPGMGTFDARVLLADRRYAGTWQHGETGGHLFGTIEPPEPADANGAAQP